ncbi:MAG: hypothetical protein Alis3KO_32630 [Aliiglaciecola sp.]
MFCSKHQQASDDQAIKNTANKENRVDVIKHGFVEQRSNTIRQHRSLNTMLATPLAYFRLGKTPDERV